MLLLNTKKVNLSYEVVSITSSEKMTFRLFELGLFVGGKLKVEMMGNGFVIVSVQGSLIAVDNSMASCIEVREFI